MTRGAKLFGKIVSLTKPTDAQGKPKICTPCTGADTDTPIIGLIGTRRTGSSTTCCACRTGRPSV
jgi:hypothetical protein